ncbi:hypothetical protein QBC36DRAFT_317229 [Triangularia setosa]|uniref:Uncharacterized protein n=1 Tax=Triangularia setosa TaxID=2587417 RepID=A0AAN6WGR2_9PEZI|nr:hypothetical protein QBC36DRAFT_317229 [Podospora setosa]
MNLTPIKVKGRGRKQAWRPPDPSRIKSSRRERDGEDDHDNVQNHSSKSSKRPKLSAATIMEPKLERLPPEILWPIAVMSQNLNLLKTNQALRKSLSSKSFLLELAVGAFRPTWDRYFGRPRHLMDPDEYTPRRFPGDPQFQSNVLAAPWINIKFVLEAQQIWYRQTATKRHCEKVPCMWWTFPTQVPQNGERQQAQEGQHAEYKQQEGLGIRDWFNRDWQEFCEACAQILGTRLYRPISQNIASDTRKGYIDLHPLTAVPDRLLKEPFDLERTKLLFWLVRGGARILPEHNWEVTKLGFEQLMADGSTLAPYMIFFYHALGVFDEGHWPDFVLQDEWVRVRAMREELVVSNPNYSQSFEVCLYDFALGFLGTHKSKREMARDRN